MQSEARNAQKRSFLFGIPVAVDGSPWCSTVAAAATLMGEREEGG
jgi:hypothetical protein